MSPPTIAVIGVSGQVSHALARAAIGSGMKVVRAGRPQVDLENADSIADFLDSAAPSVVINAAAYTAVDKAETDADAAFCINAEGPGRLAKWCAAHRVPLIHISTDYVFDGCKAEKYLEDDARNPLSVYGQSKSAGEDAVRAALAEHIIVRTAWIYSTDGHNFLKTMLRLGAERDVVGVVADQFGTPTPADGVAGALLNIAAAISASPKPLLWGTYHLTSGGDTTWHGFAEAIFSAAAEAGLKTPRLEAIGTADYPLAAQRPAYGVLDTGKIRQAFGIELAPWQHGVADAVRALSNGRN